MAQQCARSGSATATRSAALQRQPRRSSSGSNPPHSPPPQVRAQSLQELVYKQGSAGITKASVSITFHNDDPANGPSGYEDKELITVTRQVCAVDCGGPYWQLIQALQSSSGAAGKAGGASALRARCALRTCRGTRLRNASQLGWMAAVH